MDGGGSTRHRQDGHDVEHDRYNNSYPLYPPINLPPLGASQPPPPRSMSGSPVIPPFNSTNTPPPRPPPVPIASSTFMSGSNVFRPYRIPSPSRNIYEAKPYERHASPVAPSDKRNSPGITYSQSSYSKSNELPSLSLMNIPRQSKMSVSSMLGDPSPEEPYRGRNLPPYNRDPFRPQMQNHQKMPATASPRTNINQSPNQSTPTMGVNSFYNQTLAFTNNNFPIDRTTARPPSPVASRNVPSSPKLSHSVNSYYNQDIKDVKEEEGLSAPVPIVGLGSPIAVTKKLNGTKDTPSNVSFYKPNVIVQSDKVWKSLQGLPDAFLGHFLYSLSLKLPCFEPYMNGLFTVRIPAEYVSHDNLKVKKRALWGTDIYSDDSDVVAMVIHLGLISLPNPLDTPQPFQFKRDLLVRLRVVPRLEKYTGSMRHGIKSRKWKHHDGASLAIVSLEQLDKNQPICYGRKARKDAMRVSSLLRKRAMAGVEPNAPLLTISDPWVRLTTLEFNSENEPCFAFFSELLTLGMASTTTKPAVDEDSQNKETKSSPILRKSLQERLVNEVLFLENSEERYELSRDGTSYRFAVVKTTAMGLKRKRRTLPLPMEDLAEIVGNGLSLKDDVQWVQKGVVVKSRDSKEGTFCVVKRIWWEKRTEDQPNKKKTE